jgi:predicted SpoU family rRNA methylase
LAPTEETKPARSKRGPDEEIPAYVIWQRLLDKTEALTLQQVQLQSKVDEAVRELATVRLVLRGDDYGKNSLLHEFADLRKTVDSYSKTMEEVKKALEGRAVEDVKGKWDLTKSMIVALVAGILAIAGAIIAALVRGK